jgi:hypothetical protein
MKNKILNSIYVALFLFGTSMVQANGVPNPLNNTTNNPIMPPPPSPANPPGTPDDDEASIDFGLVYLLMAGAATGIYLLSKKYKKQEA